MDKILYIGFKYAQIVLDICFLTVLDYNTNFIGVFMSKRIYKESVYHHKSILALGIFQHPEGIHVTSHYTMIDFFHAVLKVE